MSFIFPQYFLIKNIKVKVEDDNFYTFENPTAELQPEIQEPNSRERLKRANEYIQSLRKSSPGKLTKSSDYFQNSNHFNTYGKLF